MRVLKGTRRDTWPRLYLSLSLSLSMTGALGTFKQISALLNSSHCLPTDVLPDDEHKERIRNSNTRTYTYIRMYVRTFRAYTRSGENALSTHSRREINSANEA